jgi:hypothetical protein
LLTPARAAWILYLRGWRRAIDWMSSDRANSGSNIRHTVRTKEGLDRWPHCGRAEHTIVNVLQDQRYLARAQVVEL